MSYFASLFYTVAKYPHLRLQTKFMSLWFYSVASNQLEKWCTHNYPEKLSYLVKIQCIQNKNPQKMSFTGKAIIGLNKGGALIAALSSSGLQAGQ